MDEAIGFFNNFSYPELIEQLEIFDLSMMFIGLIFDVLIIIFIVVAILLVFSLLLISVESKAFELGVMRLVGLTKLGFISMVLTQAVMFVLPAIISAFTLSLPIIYFIYASLIGDSLGYMPSILPSGKATLNALFVGLVIPLASSIIPIRQGLKANLTETLNVTRSKSKGILVSLVDNKAINVVPYMVFGTVAVSLGIIIYYGLPVALLELNLGRTLTIFFLLLLAMLLGLVLFAINLQ